MIENGGVYAKRKLLKTQVYRFSVDVKNGAFQKRLRPSQPKLFRNTTLQLSHSFTQTTSIQYGRRGDSITGASVDA